MIQEASFEPQVLSRCLMLLFGFEQLNLWISFFPVCIIRYCYWMFLGCFPVILSEKETNLTCVNKLPSQFDWQVRKKAQISQFPWGSSTFTFCSEVHWGPGFVSRDSTTSSLPLWMEKRLFWTQTKMIWNWWMTWSSLRASEFIVGTMNLNHPRFGQVLASLKLPQALVSMAKKLPIGGWTMPPIPPFRGTKNNHWWQMKVYRDPLLKM